MAVTQQVSGLQTMWQSVKSTGGSANPSTYVTRLACMQDALRVHLERLKQSYPNRKVAIIAFHNVLECYISGANYQESVEVINGEDFSSLQNGMDSAFEFSRKPWNSVNVNYDGLRKYVDQLQTKGATALGPALAFALGLAKYHKERYSASTEIFLCTDGAANTGIGTVSAQSYGSMSQASKHGRPFYSQAGEVAVAQSAKINIIGITGEGVSLDVLSVAAQISGGVVTTVQADELRREIRAASQRRIIAKDATVKVHIPKDWKFLPAPRQDVVISGNTITCKLAQVDDETGIGFAFSIKNEKGNTLTGTIPIQAQIKYTSTLTGAVNVRILNQAAPLTADRELAESAANIAAVGTHALQTIAHAANQVLVSNINLDGKAKSQVSSLRDSLYAYHQLLIRAATNNTQQEELSNFTMECSALDMELERISSGRVYGASRDQAAKLFVRLASLQRNGLVNAAQKVGQVKRRQWVK